MPPWNIDGSSKKVFFCVANTRRVLLLKPTSFFFGAKNKDYLHG
jgi:hypothetical protein